MDKNKIIEAAAKLVAKGAYDKAAKEYQKVLDADPKDVRVLQKMGELYQKKNDNVQAAVFFTKVAESYASDGFFLKAVALYKQVLKLDPSLIDINIRLAELHQQLQLLGEAMAYFQIVANHYDKNGDAKRSLDILKKMVELDPENVPSRVKLADLYLRQQRQAEALDEFRRAAEQLKKRGQVDDYLRVAERLSTLEPNNFKLAKELADLYIQRSDQKRALAKLQVCFKADPRDVDTLKLLAVAFQGLGQTSKTVSVYKELIKVYDETGRGPDAQAVWDQLEQLDPNDADVIARRAPKQAAPAAQAAVPAPPPPPSRGSGVQAAPASRGSGVQPAQPGRPNIGKLLTETDVYVKYGLHDKALEHLRKVFAVEPESIDAHEKAYHIYVASNNQGQAFEQLLNVLRLHTRSGDVARAQPFLSTMLQLDPNHAEVPAFLSVLRPGAAAPAGDEGDDAILVESSEEEVIVADEPHEDVVSAEVAAAAEESAEDEAVVSEEDDMALSEADAEAAGRVEIEPPPVGEDFAPEPGLLAAEADEPITGRHQAIEGDDAAFGDGEAAEESEEVVEETDDSADVAAAAAMGFDAPPLDEPEPDDQPTRIRSIDARQVEAASFAAAEEAPSFADELSPQAVGEEEAVEAPPEESLYEEPAAEASAEAAYAAEEPPAPASFEAPAAAEEPAAEPPAEDEPASEECDEAQFFVEQGLADEAREILETVLIAYPEHRRAAALLAQLDAPPPAAEEAPADAPVDQAAITEDGEGRDAFDLARELETELGDFAGGGGEEAAAPTSGGDDYQVSVDEVFSEFKKGIEKVVKPEDVDTHYDLGIAYKEMGLADDAISEFQVARKGCIGKRKEIDCLTMIGMLSVDKGDFPVAIDAYLQGLASEHATGDVEKALRYELAAAYEASGKQGKALAQFMKVRELDGGYRDVAGRIETLAQVTAPEDDEPPPPPPKSSANGATAKPGAARKVGFI